MTVTRNVYGGASIRPDSREFAIDLTQRLASQEILERAILLAQEQSVQGWGWSPTNLGSGGVGLALVHLAAARAGGLIAGVDHVASAVEHLRRAANATARLPFHAPGLLGGTAGLGHAMRQAAEMEPRLIDSRDALDDKLAEQVLLVNEAQLQARHAEDYDVISGSAGVLMYLLSLPAPTGRVEQAIASTTSHLVNLVLPERAEAMSALVIRPEQYPMTQYERDFPEGYLNLGFAHGLPGIVSALSWAARTGVSVPRLTEARDACVRYLLSVGPDLSWGTGVPVSREGVHGEPTSVDECHVAWCYGGPGVAASLLAAAVTSNNSEVLDAATQAFRRGLEHYRAKGGAISGTFCHGHAGMVVLARLFAAHDSAFCCDLLALEEELLTYRRAKSILGVQDQEVPGTMVDDPSLLSGSAGVALTILDTDLTMWAPIIGWAGPVSW